MLRTSSQRSITLLPSFHKTVIHFQCAVSHAGDSKMFANSLHTFAAELVRQRWILPNPVKSLGQAFDVIGFYENSARRFLQDFRKGPVAGLYYGHTVSHGFQ